MRVNVLLLGLGIVLLASQNCRAACEEDREFFRAYCSKVIRVDPSGNDVILDYKAPIRTLADPDDPNATVWGSYKVHNHDTSAPGDDCNSGKENCQNEDYTYFAISINANWQITDLDGLVWTKADNERYWNRIYLSQGYTKVSDIDYTKNCHGYAFGTGNWAQDAAAGVDILINNPSGQMGEPVCYLGASECEAEIAVQTNRTHSIKIISCEECEDPAGAIQGITETREKFRESGVYKKTMACVDGGIQPDNPMFDGLEGFTLYKKNVTP